MGLLYLSTSFVVLIQICKALQATGQQYFTSTLLTAYRIDKHFSFASHVVNEFCHTRRPHFPWWTGSSKTPLKAKQLEGRHFRP